MRPRTSRHVHSDKRRHALRRRLMRAQQWPRGRASTDQRDLGFALRRRRAGVFLTCREGERGRRQRCMRRQRLRARLPGCSTSCNRLAASTKPHDSHTTTCESPRQRPKQNVSQNSRVCAPTSHPGPLRFFFNLRINPTNRPGTARVAGKTCLDRLRGQNTIWLRAWASRRSRLRARQI